MINEGKIDTHNNIEKQAAMRRENEKVVGWKLVHQKNVHVQKNGFPCISTCSKIRHADLLAKEGLIAQTTRYLYMNQSSMSGKRKKSVGLNPEDTEQ